MTKTKWNEVYNKTYKAIIKYHNKHSPDIGEIKFDETPSLSNDLEVEGIINFGLYERGTTTDDWWLQAEYYSKIGKTIIFSYDYLDCFDNLEEFADTLAKTEADIQDFESKLSIKK